MPPVAPANPMDVIDLTTYDALITDLETAFAGTGTALAAGAGGVGAAGVGLVVSAGLLLDYDLLNNKHWNGFWINVGGRLNDVWHAAASHLWGGGAPSLDTVAQMVQLAQHITMRASRQLVSSSLGKIMVAQTALLANVRRLANAINHNGVITQQLVGGARAFASAVMRSAEVRAIKREVALEIRVGHMVEAKLAQERALIQSQVFNFLHREIVKLDGQVVLQGKQLNNLSHNVTHNITPKLVLALAIATEAGKAANAAKTFVDECGEPMCNIQGPKTDWGKLFKRFGPAALFALLAAVAASDPEAVGDTAEAFGRTFGPVLEHWTKAWLGIIPGGTSGDTAEVGRAVGQIPL